MDERTKDYCGCLYYSTAALSRMVTKIADEEFKTTGLSSSHAFVLLSVNKEPGIQPCELSAQLLLEPSTITRLIEKLEAQDLVTRVKDGKQVHVQPTTAGKKKLKDLQVVQKRLHQRFDDALGKKKNDELTASLYAALDKFSH